MKYSVILIGVGFVNTYETESNRLHVYIELESSRAQAKKYAIIREISQPVLRPAYAGNPEYTESVPYNS